MSLSLTVTLLLPLLLLATCWFYTAQITRSSSSARHLRNKRICLLIAHPDDEAMFFAPTLLALTLPEAGNHVKILCLSTGDADNLGATRRQELQASAALLGLRDASDVFVLDSPQFRDGMTTTWSVECIAAVLSSAFTPSPTSSTAKAPNNNNNNNNPNPPQPSTIDILLTFDAHGVSSHPNHTSLFLGAHAWLASLTAGKPGWGACPVELYVLTTTSLLRKYIGVLDAPLTMLLGVLRSARGKKTTTKKSSRGKAKEAGPKRILFVSDPWRWVQGQRAMVKGHRSQMRWFRWGWVGVGRYMVVNEVRREEGGGLGRGALT